MLKIDTQQSFYTHNWFKSDDIENVLFYSLSVSFFFDFENHTTRKAVIVCSWSWNVISISLMYDKYSDEFKRMLAISFIINYFILFFFSFIQWNWILTLIWCHSDDLIVMCGVHKIYQHNNSTKWKNGKKTKKHFIVLICVVFCACS